MAKCLGCNTEVTWPKICCSKDECKEVIAHLKERHDYWMSTLDREKQERER